MRPVIGIVSAILLLSALQVDKLRSVADCACRLLSSPVRDLSLGGVVRPGHEYLGSVHASVVLNVLGEHRTIEEALPAKQANLGPLSSVLSLPLNQPCRDSDVLVTGLRLSSLQETGTARPNLAAELAARLELKESDLEAYAIVTSVLRGTFSLEGCDNLTGRAEIERDLNQRVWGYRASLPLPSKDAVGNRTSFSVLQLFEIDEVKTRRTIRVRSIRTNPAGATVLWLDRVRVGSANPSGLPDTRFRNAGLSPSGALDLWTGRFYFRFRHGKMTKDDWRDLTRADNDSELVFQVGDPRR